MCGDFNSNVIWNNEHKTTDDNGNAKDQTNINVKLNNNGLYSVYQSGRTYIVGNLALLKFQEIS